MNRHGYQDLKDEIQAAPGVSQAAVGAQMGYRPDEFSRVLSGYQPPKGGMEPQEFRDRVRRVLVQLTKQEAGAR